MTPRLAKSQHYRSKRGCVRQWCKSVITAADVDTGASGLVQTDYPLFDPEFPLQM
jgi:hypothetical protein